jgi:hypothetical protein
VLPVSPAGCYIAFVDNQQKRKPRFWPALFGGAFLAGGILWCVWMWFIVQKTRASRDNSFFVPIAGQTLPEPGGPVTMPSNAPTANSGATTNLK